MNVRLNLLAVHVHGSRCTAEHKLLQYQVSNVRPLPHSTDDSSARDPMMITLKLNQPLVLDGTSQIAITTYKEN
jgi:hypothetical protein